MSFLWIVMQMPFQSMIILEHLAYIKHWPSKVSVTEAPSLRAPTINPLSKAHRYSYSQPFSPQIIWELLKGNEGSIVVNGVMQKSGKEVRKKSPMLSTGSCSWNMQSTSADISFSSNVAHTFNPAHIMCFIPCRHFAENTGVSASESFHCFHTPNYLKSTLSNRFCPEWPDWPECLHTSWIRIVGPINRTIMLMNHCQTHLWWPTFHSRQRSVHQHVEANHFLFLTCSVYDTFSLLDFELRNEHSMLFHLSVHVVVWTLWLLKAICI